MALSRWYVEYPDSSARQGPRVTTRAVNQLDACSQQVIELLRYLFNRGLFLPSAPSLISCPSPPLLPLFFFPFFPPLSPFLFAYTPSYVCLLTATAAIGVVSGCVVVVLFLLRILVVTGDIETLTNKLSPRVQPFLRGAVKNLWYSTVCRSGFLDLDVSFCC